MGLSQAVEGEEVKAVTSDVETRERLECEFR